MGWKNVDKNLNYKSFVMVHHCQAKNFTDMDICQKNGTFGREELLKSEKLGFYKETSRSLFNESSMWTGDMTVTYHGRQFTLNPSTKMTKAPDHVLIFEVDENFDYWVWLHDENFTCLLGGLKQDMD